MSLWHSKSSISSFQTYTAGTLNDNLSGLDRDLDCKGVLLVPVSLILSSPAQTYHPQGWRESPLRKVSSQNHISTGGSIITGVNVQHGGGLDGVVEESMGVINTRAHGGEAYCIELLKDFDCGLCQDKRSDFFGWATETSKCQSPRFLI